MGFSGRLYKERVIGLLCSVALSLGTVSIVDPITIGIAVLSFVAMSFTKADRSIVITGSGLLGALFL